MSKQLVSGPGRLHPHTCLKRPWVWGALWPGCTVGLRVASRRRYRTIREAPARASCRDHCSVQLEGLRTAGSGPGGEAADGRAARWAVPCTSSLCSLFLCEQPGVGSALDACFMEERRGWGGTGPIAHVAHPSLPPCLRAAWALDPQPAHQAEGVCNARVYECLCG